MLEIIPSHLSGDKFLSSLQVPAHFLTIGQNSEKGYFPMKCFHVHPPNLLQHTLPSFTVFYQVSLKSHDGASGSESHWSSQFSCSQTYCRFRPIRPLLHAWNTVPTCFLIFIFFLVFSAHCGSFSGSSAGLASFSGHLHVGGLIEFRPRISNKLETNISLGHFIRCCKWHLYCEVWQNYLQP